MKISINGDSKEFERTLSVSELISELQIPTRGLIIELNGSVLGRDRFDATTLTEGDRVELIRFVGGG